MLPDVAIESRGPLYVVAVALSDQAVEWIRQHPDYEGRDDVVADDRIVISMTRVDELLDEINDHGLTWRLRTPSVGITPPAFVCPSPELEWIDDMRFEEAQR